LSLISFIVLSLNSLQPIITWFGFFLALVSVEIVKYCLNMASLVGILSLDRTNCACVVECSTTIDGSDLMSASIRARMFVVGLNFALAAGVGKYARIVNEWVLSTTTFCAGATLSLLDLLGFVTTLKGGSAASEDAMVIAPELVIDLREKQVEFLRENWGAWSFEDSPNYNGLVYRIII